MAEGRKHRLSFKQLRLLFARGILRGRGSGKNRKVEYTKGASGNGAGKADHSATRGARVAAGKAIAANADQGAITLARRLKGLTSADKAKLAARPKTLSARKENRPTAVYSPEARARLQGARAALTGQKPDYSATRAARVAAGKKAAADFMTTQKGYRFQAALGRLRQASADPKEQLRMLKSERRREAKKLAATRALQRRDFADTSSFFKR